MVCVGATGLHKNQLQPIMQLHATSFHRFSCSPSKIKKFHNWLWSGCLQKWQKNRTGLDFKILLMGSAPKWGILSRPCPTPVTHPVKRLVSLEVILLYWSSPDLVHHSLSQTCITHLTSIKSTHDPSPIPLSVLVNLCVTVPVLAPLSLFPASHPYFIL